MEEKNVLKQVVTENSPYFKEYIGSQIEYPQ